MKAFLEVLSKAECWGYEAIFREKIKKSQLPLQKDQPVWNVGSRIQLWAGLKVNYVEIAFLPENKVGNLLNPL